MEIYFRGNLFPFPLPPELQRILSGDGSEDVAEVVGIAESQFIRDPADGIIGFRQECLRLMDFIAV